MFWVVASAANRERGVNEGSLDRAGLLAEHVQLTAGLHHCLVMENQKLVYHSTQIGDRTVKNLSWSGDHKRSSPGLPLGAACVPED